MYIHLFLISNVFIHGTAVSLRTGTVHHFLFDVTIPILDVTRLKSVKQDDFLEELEKF
jgi:hypothetical protein